MSKTDNLDPYESLANAIVLQAVKDYRSAYWKTKGKRKNETASRTVGECRRFFRSGWFSALTEIDPEYLIRRLEQEVER